MQSLQAGGPLGASGNILIAKWCFRVVTKIDILSTGKENLIEWTALIELMRSTFSHRNR